MDKRLLVFFISWFMSTSPLFADEVDGLCNTKAGRCKQDQLTQEETLNSLFLADKIAAQIKAIETKERRSGREFKVAIIGRMGTNLKSFRLFRDADENGRPRDIHGLIRSLKVGEEYYNQNIDTRTSQYNSPDDLDPDKLQQETDTDRHLKYSHVGIILKNHNESEPEKGYWTVMHLLYTCNDNRSFVFEEGLGAFFMDDMKEHSAEIIVPTLDIQEKIEDLLLRKRQVYKWLNPRYNAAATPDDLREQNSNQWVLEVLAAVQGPVGAITSRADAVDVLKATDYRTSLVKPKGLYSLINFPGASKILPSTVCMARQPYFKKYGIGQLVTALSLKEYLLRLGQLFMTSEVHLEPHEKFESPKIENNRRENIRRPK